MRRILLICVMGLLFSASADVCSAAPVEWAVADGGNGHFYQYVSARTITWANARLAAEGRMVDGAQGHLATITSQAENDFIAANCMGFDLGAWLGGWQEVGAGPAEGWHWVTGEPWDYTNWQVNQPDDWNGWVEEDRLDMYGFSDLLGPRSYWNDSNYERPDFWIVGYVVEYPVPEPATISLIAIGAGALVRRRAGQK